MHDNLSACLGESPGGGVDGTLAADMVRRYTMAEERTTASAHARKQKLAEAGDVELF